MAEPISITLAGPVKAVRLLDGPPAAEPAPDPDAIRRELEARIEKERQALLAARQALDAAARRLDVVHAEAVAEAERHLADLALEIARRVLMQEIDAERYRIDPILKEALSRVRSGPRNVVVHLNPADHKRCELKDDPDHSHVVRFVPDPAVSRAECLIDVEEGVIESSIEQNLTDIADALSHPE